MGRFINRVNAEAYMAMRDVEWRDYLFGPEHEAVMVAYNKEWTSLKETGVLVELDPTHPDYKFALSHATSGRCSLEFKRVGVEVQGRSAWMLREQSFPRWSRIRLCCECM